MLVAFRSHVQCFIQIISFFFLHFLARFSYDPSHLVSYVLHSHKYSFKINIKEVKLFGFILTLLIISVSVIFKVYDSDCNGKVAFNDILEVLKDLTGSFMTDKQREVLPMLPSFSPQIFMNLFAPEI